MGSGGGDGGGRREHSTGCMTQAGGTSILLAPLGPADESAKPRRARKNNGKRSTGIAAGRRNASLSSGQTETEGNEQGGGSSGQCSLGARQISDGGRRGSASCAQPDGTLVCALASGTLQHGPGAATHKHSRAALAPFNCAPVVVFAPLNRVAQWIRPRVTHPQTSPQRRPLGLGAMSGRGGDIEAIALGQSCPC